MITAILLGLIYGVLLYFALGFIRGCNISSRHKWDDQYEMEEMSRYYNKIKK